MLRCCQPLVFRLWVRKVFWVCRACRHYGLWWPQPAHSYPPAVSLCRGSVMDINTAKPCKELKPLHFLMHPHLFFAIRRVSGVDDSAAEPRKELRPLRVLCVSA